MKKYMILIDGKPAIFDGGQLVYAGTNYRGAGVKISQMYNSRQKAKSIMLKSKKYREANGWKVFDYGSIPIILDNL